MNAFTINGHLHLAGKLRLLTLIIVWEKLRLVSSTQDLSIWSQDLFIDIWDKQLICWLQMGLDI